MTYYDLPILMAGAFVAYEYLTRGWLLVWAVHLYRKHIDEPDHDGAWLNKDDARDIIMATWPVDPFMMDSGGKTAYDSAVQGIAETVREQLGEADCDEYATLGAMQAQILHSDTWSGTVVDESHAAVLFLSPESEVRVFEPQTGEVHDADYMEGVRRVTMWGAE